ncbi:zinc-type alcohol dehydrogenase-like protein YdjL [Escherichia coli]|uniref:Zinc-type alcohol dehydrogenase-like protein YdjL n=1 Tax=Escherichia coli TaxID=562 RepID=A0A376LPB0_ECOLX|nr:zinc-type alcohol dehydrogenase-like protein YdjL [Escherichia coli]
MNAPGANYRIETSHRNAPPEWGSGTRWNGLQTLDFSINDITAWNKSIIGHMAYDSTSWRNAIRLLASGAIKVKPMITHRIGLSQWREGFDAMVDKNRNQSDHDLRL